MREQREPGGQEEWTQPAGVALVGLGDHLFDHDTGQRSAGEGEVAWDGSPGDLLIVPAALHALEALEDSARLLTVAKSGYPVGSGSTAG